MNCRYSSEQKNLPSEKYFNFSVLTIIFTAAKSRIILQVLFNLYIHQNVKVKKKKTFFPVVFNKQIPFIQHSELMIECNDLSSFTVLHIQTLNYPLSEIVFTGSSGR